MGLEEESVLIRGHLEHLADFLVARIRHRADAQGEQVRLEFDGLVQNRIENLEDQPRAVGADLRLAILVVADELHVELPGLLVEVLLEPEGPDVAVEDGDVPAGIHFLELEGVLHGLAAAVAAAIGTLGRARADALDHDHAAGALHPFVLGGDHLFQIALGQDVRLEFVAPVATITTPCSNCCCRFHPTVVL